MLQSVFFFMAITFIVIVLNIYASVKVIRFDQYDTRQKSIQIVLIWVLPVFAAIMFLALIRAFSEPFTRGKGPFGGGHGNASGAWFDGHTHGDS